MFHSPRLRQVIMSEIHPTDRKSITARSFPDDGFCETDSESVESEKIISRLRLNFREFMN